MTRAKLRCASTMGKGCDVSYKGIGGDSDDADNGVKSRHLELQLVRIRPMFAHTSGSAI